MRINYTPFERNFRCKFWEKRILKFWNHQKKFGSHSRQLLFGFFFIYVLTYQESILYWYTKQQVSIFENEAQKF